MTRISRDGVGLLIARSWSLRATCVRRRVGCLLVDEGHRTLASGYNGPASGMPHCIDHPCGGAHLPSGTGLDACEAIHAEANALMYCADPRRISTCYVTASPCVACCKMLLGTGCHRIVFVDEYPHPEARDLWLRSGREWIAGAYPKAFGA